MKKINMVPRIKVLDEAICISNNANTLGKCWHLIIFSPVIC